MYAVIRTGGKQYRVEPGDVLVVEKLDGDAGAEVSFDQVLALGDGGEMVLGAPIIAGALVKATLIETRKGEKIKVFKKRRRQGYRRTKGHRQSESVLKVTSIAGSGHSADWDGEVDLTPRSVLNARARGLKAEAPLSPTTTAAASSGAAPEPSATEGPLVEQPISEVMPDQPETVAAKPARKKKAAATEAEPAEAHDAPAPADVRAKDEAAATKATAAPRTRKPKTPKAPAAEPDPAAGGGDADQ